MALFDKLKAFSVRLMLLLHTLLTVWRVTVMYGDMYYLLSTATVPFILEGIYTVIKRKGIEWKWLCPCFVFYLLATLPNIWLLEINRTATFGNINETAPSNISIIGVTIPISLKADTWVLVIEESMLYVMIIGRWLLPRGEVSRGQLSDLLFTFIGIASDIMELFALFDEEPVRRSTILTYALLGVWSLSLFQFTMVLTVASRPIRISLVQNDAKMICITPETTSTSLEVFATFVSLFMQDGPFLVLRLYTILTFNIINYSLLFFTMKNVLVILLLLYRLLIKCIEACNPASEKSSKDKQKHNAKIDSMALTKDKIIAALISDANAVRKRRNNSPQHNAGLLVYGRNVIDLNSDIAMESITPTEIPTILGMDVNYISTTDTVIPTKPTLDSNQCNITTISNSVDVDENGDEGQIWISENGLPPLSQTPSPIKQLDNIFNESHNTSM